MTVTRCYFTLIDDVVIAYLAMTMLSILCVSCSNRTATHFFIVVKAISVVKT